MSGLRPATWSDASLRRTAWWSWWVQVVLLVAGVTADLLTSGAGVGEGLGQVGLGLAVTVFPLTGLLVLVRDPRQPIGWVLQAVGVAWMLPTVFHGYAAVGLLALPPGTLPGAGAAAALASSSWVAFIMAMGTFLVLLFPDGRPPTPRWRWVVWASGAVVVLLTSTIVLFPGELAEGPVPLMANPLGQEALRGPLSVALAVLLPAVPLLVVVSVAGLVVRFRRSTGIVRQQLKWLTLAGGVVALVYGTTMVASWIVSSGWAGDRREPPWLLVMQDVAFWVFVLLPVAIAVAVLRHRLFDVDVVINRALVYGALTLTLGGTYLGSVLLLQTVLRPVTGSSDLAVAASTLSVAALFRPLRRRIQALVDRRFYRRRYDAERTLQAFSGRLRSQIDLDAVGRDLQAVVEECVQPSSVRVWLRADS